MQSYKTFLIKRLEENATSGRGSTSRIAEYLSVNTSFVSQVLKNDKHFSLEQLIKLSSYLSLSEIEEEYLINLAEYERAGTQELKRFFERRIKKIEDKKNKISELLPNKKILDEIEQSIFYSNWYYSAIRLSTDIKNINDSQDIAKFLSLPQPLVNKVIKFLLTTNLLKVENGSLSLNVKSTHLPDDSHFIYNHHKNWRIKAIENFCQFKTDEDLAFTAPLTISKKDFKQVRDLLLENIKAVSKVVNSSESEQLACLNIDLFTL